MAGRKRKLNIPLLKSVIMALISLVIAFAFGLAGIGAQIAAAPVIQFLLGYTEERSKGTALGFALFAAVGAVIGTIVGGSPINFGLALVLAFGATTGAIFAIRSAANPNLALVRRFGQSVGIVLAIYLLGEGARHRIGGPLVLLPALQQLNPLLAGLIVGLATGALTTLLQVASGILLVPSLIYLMGLDASKAIATSLTVICIASSLPALGYASRGAVDRSTGSAMCTAGLAGGLVAGMILARLPFNSPVPFFSFSLVAMFLCAWRIWKMA